ncbi:MAG: ATP-binding protein [Thermoguttaceae bacterium]
MAREKILLVEDEEEIRELVGYNLVKQGYQAILSSSAEDTLKKIRAEVPDLIILDLMLPKMDGLELCRNLKRDSATQSIPIVMLTAKGEETDIVAGLELGAEDYITKPFSPRVLMARIRVILRRKTAISLDDNAALRIKNMLIHPGKHEVLVDHRPVELTATEFRVLHVLAQRPGWVFTRYQIANLVHGGDYVVTDRSIDVQIVGLRKKTRLGGRAHRDYSRRGISIKGISMRKSRLLWQLYPIYLLIILLSLTAIALYASSALRTFHLEQIKAGLEARALLVEDLFLPQIEKGDFQRIDALCKELGKKASTRITVILPGGKVVGDSDEWPRKMDNHGDRPEIIRAFAGETGDSERFSYTLKEYRKYVAVPLRKDDKIVGVLRTSLSMSVLDRAISAIQSRIALGGLIIAALTIIVSLWISRRFTRPLERLRVGARHFAGGNLTHKLPLGGSQEICDLADTLNQMAAELDEKIRGIVEQRNEREAILASMVEGVLAVDTEERLIRLNQTAARLIGVDPAWAQGRMLQEVVRNHELQQLVANTLATQQPQEDEIQLRENGGGERYLHAHGAVLRNANNKEAGAVVVLHEVTRLKKLEKVRRDFVANVSHELRTPVTSIKGFVETLLDGAMNNADELHRFLQIVAVQTDRLNAIIEDLLTLSRIEQETEKAEIILSPGSVKNVLHAAIQVCELKAADKKLRIELSCQESLQAPINAPLLEQAIINLLDNAVKYSTPGGVIHLGAQAVGKEVVIQVRDHGCGIAREHLPRIFERFYRVDKARSRKLGGTGLGLAIVKHIAQAHGGRADVESIVEQGSTFFIYLPCDAAESSEK